MVNSIEYSTLLIKPDLVRDGAVSRIRYSTLESGLEIIAEQEIVVTKWQALQLYWNTNGLLWEMIDYMNSGISQMLFVRDLNAIEKTNKLKGTTQLRGRKASGLRALYAINPLVNGLHSPGSKEEVLLDFRVFSSQTIYYILNFTRLGDELNYFITGNE